MLLCVCRVKLWASAFGGEMKSISAKYSGSQLLQKVSAFIVSIQLQVSDWKYQVEPQKYFRYYSNVHMTELERGFLVDRQNIEYARGEGIFSFKKRGSTIHKIYIYYLFSYTTVVCERHTLHCWFIYFLFFFWQSWNHVTLCVKQLFIQKLKATFFRLFKLLSEKKWLLLSIFYFFFALREMSLFIS